MNELKKILFITHDTSRSGAPIVLLHFIKWLKKYHKELDITVVALGGGGLKNDFINCSDNFLSLPNKTFLQKITKKFQRGITKNEFSRKFLSQLTKGKYDVIYANTVLAIPLGAALKKTDKQMSFIAHVHEMQTVIKLLQPNFKNYLAHIDLYLSPSDMVSNNLMINYKIPEKKIKKVHEVTEAFSLTGIKKTTKKFTVGGSGTFHWRKGSDVFLQVARYINTRYPDLNIDFVWIGAFPETERIIAEADIDKMGLKDVVHFTGLVENPIEWYKELDVFLLPSREDPFPLVCIEVGMLGIPIICFEKATGITEVLLEGGGEIVSYLNIESMAEKVIFYNKNVEKRMEDGSVAKKIFSRFIPDIICPIIFNQINDLRS